MNILITSAGQRVSLIRAFQQEMKSLKIDGNVIATDSDITLSSACHVANGSFKVPKVNEEEYIHDLLSACIRHNIQIIIPTIDTELQILSDNVSLFGANGIDCVISSPAFVKTCRSKRATSKFFQSKGIEVPNEVDKANPTFPLFIKPDNGSLSIDTYHIKSENELTEYHKTSDDLIFMRYIDKTYFNEFTVDMYYGRDHYLKCTVPRLRIKVRAGEVNKAVTQKNILVSFLKQKLDFIEGAVGCLTAQFFLAKSADEIIGIEINPRFGGGYPLSYQAGANYPRWIIEEYFFKKPLIYEDGWEDNLLMLRYDDEIIIHDYQHK